MDLDLTGRRAIVTGATGGIGVEVARVLAEEGADLVLAARTREPLEKLAAEVAEHGGRRAHPVVADVQDDGSVRALVAEAVDVLGGVDILVNSASNQQVGRHMPGLLDTTDEVFWEDVDTKLVGYLRTARAVAPHLVAQGWGRIVNIGGLGARETRSLVRSVRNVGVAALTKNLAEELGPHGVNVTVVHPGLTRTPTLSRDLATRAAAEGRTVAELEDELGANALGRLVDAAEVADVVAFLASPRSVAVNGDAVSVGGGTRGVIHY
ncbi:SDR family NAD(P)-dependent oxidoreductase [Nocardioides sp. SYSU D00038]|uniref:SDR family NAD(P)-dependent oxidoreductase n=1 Tax=Nocardioides sp. SYSU D00038 TaxID=2812554 RepID=UPI0019683527|nr:SDR family oxidoreductase [Nocardioides sp. SYSU D00038]